MGDDEGADIVAALCSGLRPKGSPRVSRCLFRSAQLGRHMLIDLKIGVSFGRSHYCGNRRLLKLSRRFWSFDVRLLRGEVREASVM